MADYSDLVPGGDVPHYENPLQKAAQNLTNPATAPIGGMQPSDMMNPLFNAVRYGMSAMGVPEEKAYPVVGGIGGEMLGMEGGHPELGMGLGSGLGSLSEEMTKKNVRGGEPNYSNPLITAMLAYGGGKAFTGVKNAINASVPSAASALAKRADEGMSSAVRGASQQFGSKLQELENLRPRQVNFSQVLAKPSMSPDVDGLLENVPSIKFLGGPEGRAGLSNLSLPESQQMLNEITGQFREAAFTKGVRPEEIPGFELVNDLKGAQNVAHPEMAGEVRPAYETIQNAADKAKGRFTFGEKAVGAPAKNAAKGDAYKTLLGARGARELMAVRQSNPLLNAIGKFTGGAGAVGVGEWLANKIGQKKSAPTDD